MFFFYLFMLFFLGVDINSKDIDGITPLHLSCFHQDYVSFCTLLSHGANIYVVYTQHFKDPIQMK